MVAKIHEPINLLISCFKLDAEPVVWLSKIPYRAWAHHCGSSSNWREVFHIRGYSDGQHPDIDR